MELWNYNEKTKHKKYKQTPKGKYIETIERWHRSINNLQKYNTGPTTMYNGKVLCFDCNFDFKMMQIII